MKKNEKLEKIIEEIDYLEQQIFYDFLEKKYKIEEFEIALFYEIIIKKRLDLSTLSINLEYIRELIEKKYDLLEDAFSKEIIGIDNLGFFIKHLNSCDCKYHDDEFDCPGFCEINFNFEKERLKENKKINTFSIEASLEILEDFCNDNYLDFSEIKVN